MPRARRRRGESPPRRDRYEALRRPAAILDFHGMGPVTSGEVRAILLEFLDASRRDGLARVRIVSGKGLHSRGRPVVRPQVVRTLTAEEAAGRIASWTTEKVSAGGDGAFSVQL